MNKQTNSTIGDYVNDGRAAVAGGIEEVAERVDQAASSLSQGAAAFTNKAATKAKDTLDSAVDYVRDYDVDAMVDNAKRYAKANPIQVLIGALVVGFVAGRMLRRS
jgi:ElaB/YqjD/DUF883 family membrane-anchored ribosome-binding protein